MSLTLLNIQGSMRSSMEPEKSHPPKWQDMIDGDKATVSYIRIQLIISVALGLSAFLSFCVLRPKWTQLYNARKKQSQSAARLPELPKTMFGWIPVLYRISEEEVLASAGLDAFVFLSFFRYAIKYLTIILLFALTVILPVNYKYTGESPFPDWSPGNDTDHGGGDTAFSVFDDKQKDRTEPYTGYLWMYPAFAYFFTWVALYLLVAETKYIIRIRQAYLGLQSTVTDRTIKLSGIPTHLRSEEKLTQFVEELGIGKVDSVMLCRNWRKLDELLAEREQCLRKLEAAWATYLGPHVNSRRTKPSPHTRSLDGDDPETTALLVNDENEHERASGHHRQRPLHTIRFGALKLKSKKIDAIDYFEEKLRRLDDRIQFLRKEEFEPTPLAFVTMESTAACQMAAQAILDPMPGQLIASIAPAPADVVWPNTYLSRNNRMLRSWTIMVITGFLTIFWVVLLVPPAAFISSEFLDKVFPGLDNIREHPIAQPLIQSGLPTLYFTLLSVAVPYLYDWLSNFQGMTSQGEVELSVVSKNFFFTFFNLFIVFTIFGSAGTFYDFYKQLRDGIKDTSSIAYTIATSLRKLWPFYANLIVLQGFGLFPFRLLEFGSVALYPFYLISAKTPRDHAELANPPVFQYGFFLPQSMLIFVICTVYSVLPSSWLVILFGLIYFLIGGFVYKYQLLYAMEHRQHSTGRGWPMICNRIIVGLVIFHIFMTSLLAFSQALPQTIAMFPLLGANIWFVVYFQRTYFPLMHFIALQSIGKESPPPLPQPSESPWDHATDRGRAVDTDPETGLRYMNPSLVRPLESPWIRKTAHNARSGNGPQHD